MTILPGQLSNISRITMTVVKFLIQREKDVFFVEKS